MEKYVGAEYNVLIEEIIELDKNLAEDSSEGLAIGRAWFQAPDVDGTVVIRYDLDEEEEVKAVKPGNLVSVKIISSTGVDLDGRFIKYVRGNQAKGNFKFVF